MTEIAEFTIADAWEVFNLNRGQRYQERLVSNIYFDEGEAKEYLAKCTVPKYGWHMAKIRVIRIHKAWRRFYATPLSIKSPKSAIPSTE